MSEKSDLAVGKEHRSGYAFVDLMHEHDPFLQNPSRLMMPCGAPSSTYTKDYRPPVLHLYVTGNLDLGDLDRTLV